MDDESSAVIHGSAEVDRNRFELRLFALSFIDEFTDLDVTGRLVDDDSHRAGVGVEDHQDDALRKSWIRHVGHCDENLARKIFLVRIFVHA